jgi:hypothetical protein
MIIMEKHPTIISILTSTRNGSMDRLGLALAMAPKGFRIDQAYAEIASAVEDGTVRQTSFGINYTIHLRQN